MKEENTMVMEEGAAGTKTAESVTAEAAGAQDAAAEAQSTQGGLPPKFKSVAALVHAYEALEAEFTRRSQRLRALEQAKKAAPPHVQGEGQPSACEQAACTEGGAAEMPAGAVRNALPGGEGAEKPLPPAGEALRAFERVPLMMQKGAGVTAPAVRPKTFEEAGRLALGYLKTAKKGD